MNDGVTDALADACLEATRVPFGMAEGVQLHGLRPDITIKDIVFPDVPVPHASWSLHYIEDPAGHNEEYKKYVPPKKPSDATWLEVIPKLRRRRAHQNHVPSASALSTRHRLAKIHDRWIASRQQQRRKGNADSRATAASCGRFVSGAPPLPHL